MFLINIDFQKKMQFYAISQLRKNPDYINLCETIGNDFNDLKKVSEFILKSIDIDSATGVFLDYIGWLVGTSRTVFDLSAFFSVNAYDVNVRKYIWFKDTVISGETSLEDNLFRKRIYAKIGYNVSTGTREENIKIIKNMTFANHVKIKRVAPLVMDITLIGKNFLQTENFKEDIERVLGLCIGIRNLKLLEG